MKINCDLINASICLTDLDKSQFQIGKDEKKYLNFSILTRKEADKFGNDLTMTYKKEKGQETKYIKGNAKSVNFEAQPAQPTGDPFESKADVKFNQDLPF
jgi:hypothetical protein